MTKVYIVAGNAKQATAWAAEGHLHKDNYVIVNDPDQLRERTGVLVAYVGTYYSRKDLHEIRQIVESAYPTTFKPTFT